MATCGVSRACSNNTPKVGKCHVALRRTTPPGGNHGNQNLQLGRHADRALPTPEAAGSMPTPRPAHASGRQCPTTSVTPGASTVGASSSGASLTPKKDTTPTTSEPSSSAPIRTETRRMPRSVSWTPPAARGVRRACARRSWTGPPATDGPMDWTGRPPGAARRAGRAWGPRAWTSRARRRTGAWVTARNVETGDALMTYSSGQVDRRSWAIRPSNRRSMPKH